MPRPKSYQTAQTATGAAPREAAADPFSSDDDSQKDDEEAVLERLARPPLRVLVSLLRTRQLKVPRKGGPGITQADVLVVNKFDLAPAVGADLDVMRRDALKMRGAGPTAHAITFVHSVLLGA
ncbi:unnamed protein product [Pelagomonas calceolata]|uniref:CobW/HypB/UreG nucleotide-binding domain-containing protein n=1 Tax=Pelagomonas calceolata TaxID=35677 RepID=A0A8J2SUQ7_9STRA|nr:unnamed protein product [Pelagomonas calceolata]